MFRLTLEEAGVFTSCEIRTIHQVDDLSWAEFRNECTGETAVYIEDHGLGILPQINCGCVLYLLLCALQQQHGELACRIGLRSTFHGFFPSPTLPPPVPLPMSIPPKLCSQDEEAMEFSALAKAFSASDEVCRCILKSDFLKVRACGHRVMIGHSNTRGALHCLDSTVPCRYSRHQRALTSNCSSYVNSFTFPWWSVTALHVRASANRAQSVLQLWSPAGGPSFFFLSGHHF